MFLDSRLEFSDRQVVTSTATTTNIVDFGQKKPNLGGAPTHLYVVMTVNQTFAGLTGLTLELEESDQESSGFAAVAKGKELKPADLAVGAQYIIPMPLHHKRYIRGRYVVAGTATAGKVSLHIVNGLQDNEPQPNSPRIR